MDARKGVLPQTKRHSRIVSMLGIQHVALAINKMDLVDWSEDLFQRIQLAYRRFAQDLGFQTITAIPVSALEGQNIVATGHIDMPWYNGTTLLNWLEPVPAEHREINKPFVMPVQWVNRCNQDFRGFAGELPAGP